MDRHTSHTEGEGLSKTFPKAKAAREPEQYFAVSGDDIPLKRFKLILRSGASFSVPYALLPIIILTSQKDLLIKSYGLRIHITGRNLEALEEELTDESVLWIKESLSGKDTGEAYVFISSIAIEGKAVEEPLPIADDE